MWYYKYVGLSNPKIQMGKNFAGNQMIMISGMIENKGEKTLDVVEVKLVLFDHAQPVWQTARIPIRPGPGTYTSPIRPLEKRGFTLYVQKIPKGWSANNAEISIHGFRFL